MAGMYSELFWVWLRKGYIAVVIGQVFIPVPLWVVLIAALALAVAINMALAAMSSKRREENR
jgi:membrane protein implicated in regulation of membrane protease activity